MNPWEGIASQALGMGLGAQRQEVDYAQRAYGAGYTAMSPYPLGNFIPIDAATTTSNTLYITGDPVPVKVEEPPDEFTQLSNHKFHELLDRFKEVR